MGTETVSAAALSVFRAELAAIRANLDGCLEGTDPSHLHDLRVANRRLRAALEEFQELLPPQIQKKFLADLRWIHQVTGEVRDLDVSLALLPDHLRDISRDWRQHLDPLVNLLNEKKIRSQAVLKDQLTSERFREVLYSWELFLEQDGLLGSSPAFESAREYGSRQVIKKYQNIRDKGPSLTKKSPPESFHAFRISVKELRYLMDFYCPSLEGEEYSRLRTEIKTLQDAFGAFQDAGVQRSGLLHIAQEIHRQEATTATMLAFGQLLGVIEKKIRRYKKQCLRQVRWLIADPTARTFQSCFQYPVN